MHKNYSTIPSWKFFDWLVSRLILISLEYMGLLTSDFSDENDWLQSVVPQIGRMQLDNGNS